MRRSRWTRRTTSGSFDFVSDAPRNEFEEASRNKPRGLLRELFDLLRTNKKWWLAPIILALLAIGALVILAATKAAPFIYPLF
jgi:hypothetical protein